MQIKFSGLHQPANAWTTGIDPSINSAASAGYQASALPDGRLLTTNVGSVAFAGGLVTRKLHYPQLDLAGLGLAYGLLEMSILVPSFSIGNLARLETDFILVVQGAPNAATPIVNKFNCSTQWNGSTGNFQVDASSGAAQWSDIGGGPGKSLAPDVPHALAIRYNFDYAGKKRSVLSITWDGVVYSVPAALQGVANQSSNWGPVLAIQKQTELFRPGSVDVIYDQTALTFSDQPL